MAKRKQRVRSPHPGVKIKRRVRGNGTVSWRAHYEDPDTGREVAVTLDPVALPTKQARTRWAINLSRDLSHKRMARVGGRAAAAVLDLEDAIELYLADAQLRLRPKTLKTYGLAIDRFREWAARSRVKRTTDLTRSRLVALREELVRAPKLRPIPGRRGAHLETGETRSELSVNRDLRALKTIIGSWRKRELTPNLHRDDILDALAALPVPHEQPRFLGPADLRRLIEAAIRHDADTYAETRAEHAGLRPVGTTTRYAPIAPFLAAALLTGMRRGEILGLRWAHVDLDALDHEGRTVGEIRLPASLVKTHRARTVGLEVSPALRRILAAHALRSGRRGHVFGGAEGYTSGLVSAAQRRLVETFGAPPFSWQLLRSTCGTYLTNAPGIFGGATVFLSAKQLGHSVQVAERHYLGVLRGVPRTARTLEAAMQIEAEVEAVVASVGGGPAREAAGG